MSSINMIAARRAETKRLEDLVRIMRLVIVGELAIILCVLGFMTARMHTANKSIHRLDQRLASLQPTVDKISRYESDIKKLEPRLDLLSESRERTLLWHAILQDLSQSMPEKTWLTSLATSQAPAGSGDQQSVVPTLSLSGFSVSQRLVGETMLRLNRFPEFRRVDLAYTQEGGDEKCSTLRFQIVARVNSQEPTKGRVSTNAVD